MSRASSRALFVVVAIAVSFAVRDVATQANQVITISLPTAVMFAVTNVNAATPGNPSSTRIQFTDGILKNKRYVSIQVRAEGDFVPPSGTAIPASRVSWTVSNAVNGTGFAGTLSKSAYTDLFEADRNATSARVDVSWQLAAPGVPLRAGTHLLTMRWRIQALGP